MYLPHSVPLSRPHVAMWFGESGKRYDFAVSRARPIWLGQPVVYVLVRYDGEAPVPLFVGRATAADPQLGGAGSEAIGAWEQAMALGMTHLHLRFEACTEEDRAAEVEDLAAALRPPLNESDGAREAPEDLELASARMSLVDEGFATLPVSTIEAGGTALATAAELPIEAVKPRRPDGWLGRTAAAFATRYHHWRRRPRLAATAAHDEVAQGEAAPGRVTVRTDAVVAGIAQGAPAAAGGEPEARRDPPPLAPEPDPAAARAAEPIGSAAGDGERGDARAAVRERLGLGADDIVVLFAGELDWTSGADLAVEAMATVHADPAMVRLLLAGSGPLCAELESRAWHGGFAHACRFLGDLPAEAFAEVFAACDAVAIPARAAQNPMLAEHCLAAGKPVLTTHQAQLGCVRHGENGLVTYDNPGSLVWGLREIAATVARSRAPAAALAA